MELSNKKLKYIKRHAHSQPPSEIAKELNLPLEQVQKAIKELTGRPPKEEKNPTVDIAYWAFLLLLFSTPFFLISGLHEYGRLPKSSLIEVGSLLLLGIWFYSCTRKGAVSIIKSPLYFPLIGFTAWSLLSLAWAINPYDGIAQWVHWSACGLIFFVVLQLLKDRRHLHLLMATIVLVGFLVSQIGSWQYLFRFDWIEQSIRPAATFGNKNMAAQVAVLSVPAGFALFLTARRRLIVWLSALALSSIITFIFYTYTKAAWVVISCELFLLAAYYLYDLFIKHSKNRFALQRTPALLSSILLTIILIHLSPDGWKWRAGEISGAITGVQDAIADNTVEQSDDTDTYFRNRSRASSAQRLTLWKNAIQMIKEHPLLGVGINNFTVVYPESAAHGVRDDFISLQKLRSKAHNDHLQIAAELGLPGIAILAWAALVILKGAWDIIRSNLSSENRDIAVASLIAVTGLAINACFSFPMYHPTPPFLLAVYLAAFGRVSCSASSTESEDAPTWKVGNKTMALVGTILALTAFVGWSYIQYRWLMADYYFARWRFAQGRDQIQKARFNALKVKEYQPSRIEILTYLGRNLIATGEIEQALEYLEEYNRSHPHVPGNLYAIAYCYDQLGNNEEAKSVIKHAIQIVPKEGIFHDFLAKIYIREGNYEEGLKEFRTATELSPDKAFLHFNFGLNAMEYGSKDEAENAFRRAIELKDDWDIAHRNLGLLLLRHSDRQDEAVDHLKKALQLNPGLPDADEIKRMIRQHEKNNSP